MSETDLARVALRRFGLGPRADDLDRVALDPMGCLYAELRAAGSVSVDLVNWGSTSKSLQAFWRRREADKQNQRMAIADPRKTSAKTLASVDGMMRSSEGSEMDGGDNSLDILATETAYRMKLALSAELGFFERLVWFWSNHFAVSLTKGGRLEASAGSFEREAIRPHVLGQFADMLLAAEFHPAMLFYLDNYASAGPRSEVAKSKGRGLNENLGREILELHTLGVHGGYSQQDVTSLAKILTGWTVVTPKNAMEHLGVPGTTVFNPDWHEPGPLMLLGEEYRSAGPDRGRMAVFALARHPATAWHLATKFARHFVADDPPTTLVSKLANSFLKSGGSLSAMTVTLIEAPEAWSTCWRKFCTPQEFVVAGLRLCGTRSDSASLVRRLLHALGQSFWNPHGPDGYQDTFSTWGTPSGVKTRLDVALRIARQFEGDPRTLLDAAFGGAISAETRQAVMRAESRTQAVALLLMSPEFQWR